MQRLIVEGGKRLSGKIKLQGAKNSALPILSAAVLAKGKSVFTSCPELTDVYAAARILSHLGCSCSFERNIITVNNMDGDVWEISDELMRSMRSSIVFLGAVLGRSGKCRLSYPGGCELGPRPIDMHLDALKQMGVTVNEEFGVLDCSAVYGLHGAKITLQFPSVGATENIMLAAVLAKGETVIRNAGREPEIIDLAGYLNKCGAKITGAGESTIVIQGVKELHGCEYEIMPDRIAAATYIAAAAVTRSELEIGNVRLCDIESFTNVFEQMGCRIYPYGDGIQVYAKNMLRGVKTIKTMPYPGFPTDAQALVMAALCTARGTSIIEENIFDCRFKHVEGLTRMGADIKISGKAAIIEGVNRLHGAKVSSTDLRGGAALVVAALGADGVTEIDEIHHIDRGYEAIEKCLTELGANIVRR